jgi:hypothetical protein
MATSKERVSLPDGRYKAKWSAYHLEILVKGKESIKIQTDIGVKGINVDAVVVVKNGLVEIVK